MLRLPPGIVRKSMEERKTKPEDAANIYGTRFYARPFTDIIAQLFTLSPPFCGGGSELKDGDECLQSHGEAGCEHKSAPPRATFSRPRGTVSIILTACGTRAC